jgi:hypothetical protein
MSDRGEISVREWLANYDAGKYNSPDVDTMIAAGWYDWFCQDRYLLPRLQKMVQHVKRIAESPLIDQDTMYVWFKNNCPVQGSLYDDFRFSDRKTFDVIYTIVPKSGHKLWKSKSQVWDIKNAPALPEKFVPAVHGKISDVYNFFKV